MEPDAHAIYQANGVFHTFLFEQHNGKDAKRAIKQIEQHCLGLMSEAYTIRFTRRDQALVVYLFQNRSCMSVVMKAMMASPQMRRMQHLFLFKHEEELKSGFAAEWHHPDGTATSFLPSDPS